MARGKWTRRYAQRRRIMAAIAHLDRARGLLRLAAGEYRTAGHHLHRPLEQVCEEVDRLCDLLDELLEEA